MASINAALDFLERKYGNPSQPPAGDVGMDPSAAPTPRQGAQIIDFETPLPEMDPSAGPVDMLPEQDQAMVPLQDEETAQDYAPPRVSRVEQGDTFNAALDFLTRKYGDPQQAATQQAVVEATTPTENLPVLKSDLANALGVLDYRDPEEGQRRQQAAAMGEILGLPEYEKVQLGAAPVNTDGTVTIRRAQAVSPEANAAAAAKLQEDQAAAASLYKAEQSALNPSFLDKLQQRWRVGREQAVDDQLAYRAMMGEVDYEKVKGQLDPSTAPLKGGNWLSEGVLTAAQMLPAMVDGIISGNNLGLQGAMAGGTAAAIAGQAGPQVVTPEEIVTVPATAALGYAAGTAAGSADYWYKQGAGSMYHQLRKEGVPHNVSSTVAASFGAPYAAIELAQVSKLVPGVKQTAAQAVAGGIKSRLTALAKEKGVEYVEQIGQETTQELLSISGEKLAEWSAGVTPPKDKASAWERIASTIQQTATSIPFLMAPKASVDTYQTVRGNEQNQTTPPPPAPAAPAEVPQNFTPISTPAAAPATTRPRSLGEVRAPQIAVDQAAIDEAFGSPFAPPPEVNPQVNPAEDSTFAPPAPAPVNTTLPTDALPTETPGATYGREAEIYDAFANVRRTPLTDLSPAASAPVASAPIAPEPTGSPSGEGTSVSDIAGMPAVNFPVAQLKLSKDVPNFKENADPKTGVVQGEALQGKVDRRGLAPIIAWRRLNGDVEVISGRHRLDLFRRNQEETIPTQIFNEADGFTKQDALTLDAELNIRDGQGTTKDYSSYFRNAGLTYDQATERSLLSRAKGRAGFSIGAMGSDDLYALHQSGKISDAKADAIAVAAPRDVELQRVGMTFAKDFTPEALTQLITLSARAKSPTAKQGDLFGNSDENLNRAVALVKASQKRIEEIDNQILSVKGALKRPDAARKMGVDIKNPEAIQNKIAQLQLRREKYVNFLDDPATLAEVRVLAFGEEQAPLFSATQDPFNLTSETVQPPTPPSAEDTEAARRAAAIKDGYQSTPSMFGDEPPPRPFSEIMAENMKRKGEAGYIDLGVVQDFGQSIYKAGMDFAAWAGSMVQKFGEAVRDVLSSLWQSISGGQYLPQARERGSVNISPGTGPKPRKFTQSVQAAEGVMPEVKAQLNSFEYDPVSNAETVAAARAGIDAAGSIDAAFTGLMGKTAAPEWQPSAVDYATGIELLGQLQNRGRHEDAGAIANMMANRATDQGRAIQALSMISRLGPQGIEVFAQRQLTQAATSGKTEKQRTAIQGKIDEADQLRGEVGKVRHGAATAAIVGNKDLIKGELPAGVDPVKVNLAIRDAIMGSPTPLAAEAATHTILTAEGLSDKGAVRISKSIVKDFLKTSQDARAKVLQDLQAAAENDRRLDKSKLGGLMRLNREGKLTDTSLHAGMAKMLGIPHWGADQSAKVQRILAQRDRATDPRIKLVKAAEALDVVYREFMPPGLLAKIDTFQTLSMLLNTKTVTRNVLGNTLMFAGDLAADTAAVPMDALMGLGTGERTRTGLSLGERLVGLGAGVGDVQAGYRFARSEGKGVLPSLAEGVDTLVRLGRLQSSGKYDSQQISAYSGGTFTAPILRQLESTLGAVLSVADRGFYESAFRSSLDNRMKAARANGTPMLAPDADMITAARMDAARAVYQDDNAASRTLGGIRRVLNANQRWGLGSMLFKFTQVPGSILTRAIEFSPLGFIGNAYEGIAPLLSKNKEFDQKAFVDSFTRALVGTTGLVATGYWLAQLGIISAGSDAKDEDKRNLDKARGWGNYKLNVDALKRALMTGNFWTRQPQQKGDMVVSYDWAQPLSIGVAMGAYARENQDAVREDILRGKRQSLLATGMNWLAYGAGAATGAMNSLVEQPLLTGINSFMRNAGYDGLIGAVVQTAADIPGSFIPSSARQWMQLDDNAARETRDSSPFREYVNQLKAQLPGLSRTLPQKYDIAGQPVERWAQDSNTIFNVMFNPGMVTYIKGSPVLTEMGEIYRRTADGRAVANQVKPEFTLEGVKVRLTDEEISAMQKDMGALSVAAVEKFVLEDPRYAKATWDIKAKAFTRALEKAATAAKYRILLARPDLTARAKQEFLDLRAARNEQQALME